MNSTQTLRSLLAMLAVVLSGCSPPAGPADTGADAAPTDAINADVASDHAVTPEPYDAGPFSCGAATCGPAQVCYQPCSGIDVGHPIEPVCVDVPDSCGGVPTCDCVQYGACPSSMPTGAGFPACIQNSAREFVCQGCA